MDQKYVKYRLYESHFDSIFGRMMHIMYVFIIVVTFETLTSFTETAISGPIPSPGNKVTVIGSCDEDAEKVRLPP